MLLAVVLSQGEEAALPKADCLDVEDLDAFLNDEGDDRWSAEDGDYNACTMAEDTCPGTFNCFSAATTTTTRASSMGAVKVGFLHISRLPTNLIDPAATHSMPCSTARLALPRDVFLQYSSLE